MSVDAEDAKLARIAGEVREFLEPRWADWHREAGSPRGRRTLSEGTCERSSCFLMEVLRDNGYEAELAFGSPADSACGFRSETGWKGHSWVVVRAPARIVDVTADQFGDAGVIVTGLDDPRFRSGYDVAAPQWIADRQGMGRKLIGIWREMLAKAGVAGPDGTNGQTGETG